MSEEQGYIRVVNARGDEDFCPLPTEKLIMVDRTNPVLGNKHVMKTKSWMERDRDINAQSDQWSPAMQACGDGQIKGMRLLIAAGADLNASGENGMTPLMVAAMEGEDSCLALLLKTGVDLEKKDDAANTATWYAAAYANAKCLALLFKAGADISACMGLPLNPSSAAALGAEHARREKISLSKNLRKPKAEAKTPRI